MTYVDFECILVLYTKNYISGIRQCIRLFCIICGENVKKTTHACHFWMTILSKNFWY